MYEGIENKKLTECPHCGSIKIRKAGILPTGYQRYHCRNCKKKFSVLTFVKFQHKSGEICPYCKSEYTRKAGFLKDGSQRYICKSCRHSFSLKTEIKEQINHVCPKCLSSELRREGKTPDGEQRYLCKKCKNVFTPSKTKKIHAVKCPKCGHEGAVQWEKVKGNTGKPYYRCTNCSHKFMEGGRLALSEEQKELMLAEYESGVQIRDLSIKYNRKEETIRLKVKDCNRTRHLEMALNLLPSRVKRDIIYFGLGARVSIADLSKYLKVDRELVEEVIRSYKKKVGVE